jgi:thioredoxin-related protein
LAEELKKMGYQIIIVVPAPENEYSNNSQIPQGAPQESYVDMEWVKQFRLTVTPTLLVFDHAKGLIWSHEGVLDNGDPSAVIRKIKSVGGAQ